MKIIALDQITAVTPSSEDANYPATNVQDDFRTNPWQAGSAVESTLTLDISANSNALMLSFMNSGQVTVEVKDAGSSTIYGPTAHNINTDNPNLWVDYDLQAGVAQALLTFSDPGDDPPYCGIARAAYAYSFNQFGYGMQEGLKDHGISDEYNSGADYYKYVAICRTFSGSFWVARDSDFYTFMHSIVMKYGRGPYAMRLTDLSNCDWAVFGMLDVGLPKGTHKKPTRSLISLSMKEGM